MNAAKIITKGYFFGAMGMSAMHTIHSFEKMGLVDGQQYATPLAIDGFAFFGLVLQQQKYSDDTNKIGVKIQIGCGVLQLAANLFAASSLGGIVLAFLVVGIYLVAEILGGKIKTRAVDEAEKAAAEAARLAEAIEAKAAADREAKNKAARERRATRKAQEKALEELVNPSPRRRSRARHAAPAAA